MPELPEVEVTRRGIAPALTGHAVAGVIARVPALRYPLPPDLGALLAGRRLTSVARRGKYLLLDFGDGRLLIHLGMSGSLRLVTADAPAAASVTRKSVVIDDFESFGNDHIVPTHKPTGVDIDLRERLLLLTVAAKPGG